MRPKRIPSILTEADITRDAARLAELTEKLLDICRTLPDARSDVLLSLMFLLGLEAGSERAHTKAEFLRHAAIVLGWAYDEGVGLQADLEAES